MKIISPGVVALRPFKIHTNALTQEMVDFWVMMGAEAQVISDEHWTRHKQVNEQSYRIRMGKHSDWSHKFNDNTGYIIHLREEFAPEASLFMIKFPEAIINHDCKVPEYDIT
jgi:hypothetical protein